MSILYVKSWQSPSSSPGQTVHNSVFFPLCQDYLKGSPGNSEMLYLMALKVMPASRSGLQSPKGCLPVCLLDRAKEELGSQVWVVLARRTGQE